MAYPLPITQSKFPCGTGALLYSPGNSPSLAIRILEGKIPTPYTMALCLEDTIPEHQVDQAVETLCHSLATLHQGQEEGKKLPPLFIRVRNPQQIPLLKEKLAGLAPLVEGIIAPKIRPDTLKEYGEAIQEVASHQDKPWLFMPILESPQLVDLRARQDFLYQLKEGLSPLAPLVPSVRVGGNDLCHLFSLRRNPSTTIHQIPVISQLFGDIISIFSRDYPVSGAVWEYYDGPSWDSGLERETREDRAFGFLGKTVIHPKQIPLVNRAYQVTDQDYEDACSILNWSPDRDTLVEGSALQQRMNEPKTHSNWALRTLLLAQEFGRVSS